MAAAADGVYRQLLPANNQRKKVKAGIKDLIDVVSPPMSSKREDDESVSHLPQPSPSLSPCLLCCPSLSLSRSLSVSLSISSCLSVSISDSTCLSACFFFSRASRGRAARQPPAISPFIGNYRGIAMLMASSRRSTISRVSFAACCFSLLHLAGGHLERHLQRALPAPL